MSFTVETATICCWRGRGNPRPPTISIRGTDAGRAAAVLAWCDETVAIAARVDLGARILWTVALVLDALVVTHRRERGSSRGKQRFSFGHQ